MTSAPPPPPGWKPHPVVPTSQQQAQDMLLAYLRKTLQGLPGGATLDATGFGGATNTPPCEDVIHGTPRKALTTTGELKVPAGSDPRDVIAKVGDLWRHWGWYVMERDGFRHPNQFGYAPDGYSLQIVVAAREGFGPTVQGTSPCFPSDLSDDRASFPLVLSAD